MISHFFEEKKELDLFETWKSLEILTNEHSAIVILYILNYCWPHDATKKPLMTYENTCLIRMKSIQSILCKQAINKVQQRSV